MLHHAVSPKPQNAPNGQNLNDPVTNAAGLHSLPERLQGSAKHQEKARFGRSKERRSDCPLLTLGLILDGGGFLRRCEIFPGNAVEGETLGPMLA